VKNLSRTNIASRMCPSITRVEIAHRRARVYFTKWEIAEKVTTKGNPESILRFSLS